MRSNRPTLVAAMTLVIVAATPLAVLAREGFQRDVDEAVQAQERATDLVGPTKEAIDRPTAGPSGIPSDRPSDRLNETPRRCHDRVTDEVRDCVQVHRCLRLTDNPRRCIDVELRPDLDLRHLIWRLIHAHQWELLHRLHWLGF